MKANTAVRPGGVNVILGSFDLDTCSHRGTLPTLTARESDAMNEKVTNNVHHELLLKLWRSEQQSLRRTKRLGSQLS